MAAGDLITGDWQLEVRTTLMGDTTDFQIDRTRGGVSGLFDSEGELAETGYAHQDGSTVGVSRNPARTATFALEICESTAAAAGTALGTMLTAWDADTDGAIPLYFQFPGFGKSYVNGYPLGLVIDYSTADFGVIPLIASFRITDPTIYT